MHVVGLSLAAASSAPVLRPPLGRPTANRENLTPSHLLATRSGRPRLPLLSLHVPLLKISLTLWQQEFTGGWAHH